MFKIALNPLKERGFDSKAQMRYLLMRYREDPEKFAWVRDVLRNHGAPKVEGPLRTYWEPPYNISPATPSYVYKGRAAEILGRMIRLANKLDDAGNDKMAVKLDNIMKPFFIDHKKAQQVANTFWTIWRHEYDPHNPESLIGVYERLSSFAPFSQLDPATQEEARRIIGDKILGRNK